MSGEKTQEPVQTHQPQQTPGMTLKGGNRNAKGLPVDADGKRDWSFPLFGCFSDMSKCCWACWCPCVIHAQNRRRIDHLNKDGTPDPNADEKITGDSVVYGVIEACFNMGWVIQIATRKDIRDRYNIRGSSGDDCFVPFCCQPCDLVQGAREVELEERTFKHESQAPQV